MLKEQSKGGLVPLALHDVSADNYSKMGPIIDFCRTLGWLNIDLMVIPKNDHLNGQQKSEFSEFLKDQKLKGAKLWLHGLNHNADALNFKTLKGKLVQPIVRSEAEFCGMTKSESIKRLEMAFESWKVLDVGEPFGFVPPTWHVDAWLKNEVIKRGVAFESRFYHVSPDAEKSFSLPLSLLDRDVFWGLNKALFRPLLAFKNSIRIVLHPFDFDEKRRSSTENWLKEVSTK